MGTAAAASARPWAFWAPAPDRSIEAALTLAGVGPGDDFVDLGCGDGRVLLAAARRGARVRGYEIDSRMAKAAHRALTAEGLVGEILEHDLFEADVSSELLYAYLTPALLVRLAHALTSNGFAGRLVTPRYALAGWACERSNEEAYLYQFPLRPLASAEATGWQSRALLATVPARKRFLVPCTFVGARGPLVVELSRSLRRLARAAVGETWLDDGKVTAVDLQFEPCQAGSVLAGQVTLQGHELAVAVVYADSDFQQRHFGPEEGRAFREQLALAVRSARGGAS